MRVTGMLPYTGVMAMRVHCMELQSGDKLTKDIFNSFGLHVLSAGTVLDNESVTRLICHNIDYVEIERSLPQREDASVQPGLAPAILLSYDASIAGMNYMFQQALIEGKIDPGIVDTSFEPLADSIRKETDLVNLILSLASQDEYTQLHCVQVGMLTYYISKWMGYSEEFALEAGKAGYLHDIGKSLIDSKILTKPSKLTDNEFDSVKQHTVLGHEILSRSYNPDSPIALGALQHHERLDGSGYPSQLHEDQIHPVAKIIAVADIYSAMINSRIYQKERDMLYVLQELHRLSFGQIDPNITQVFIRNMVPNFLGKTIILESGQKGSILMTNPSDLFRPLIQVGNEFIDLSKRTDLHVSKILI